MTTTGGGRAQARAEESGSSASWTWARWTRSPAASRTSSAAEKDESGRRRPKGRAKSGVSKKRDRQMMKEQQKQRKL